MNTMLTDSGTTDGYARTALGLVYSTASGDAERARLLDNFCVLRHGDHVIGLLIGLGEERC